MSAAQTIINEQLRAENAALVTERDRLRDALTRIAHGVHDDATYDVFDCALIAREALAGEAG